MFQDNVTKIKTALAEIVDNWNYHLGEAIRKSDRKKEKNAVSDLESPANEASEKHIFDSFKEPAHSEKGLSSALTGFCVNRRCF